MAQKKLSEILRENEEKAREERQKEVARINREFEETYRPVNLPIRRPSVGSNIGYIGRSTGVSLLGGIAGLGQGLLTDAANNMRQGKNQKILPNIANLITGSNIAANIPTAIMNSAKSNIDTLKDKDKTAWEKIVALPLNAVSNAKQIMPLNQQMSAAQRIAGRVNPTADETALKLNERISAPVNKLNEELQQESQNHGGITNFVASGGRIIANLAPSIAAYKITGDPSVSLGVMGLSAKGQSTNEALSQGKNLEDAVKIGDAKALIEVATERLLGGVKIFGKGTAKLGKKTIDELAEELVEKGAKSTFGKFLAKQGINIAGETTEEWLSNLANNFIDRGTVDPDRKLVDPKEMIETAGQTAFTTALLGGMTGQMRDEYRQARADVQAEQQAQNYLNEAQKIINQENLTEKLKNDVADTAIQRAEANEGNKNIAIKEINESRINNEEKQQMIQALNSMENVTDEDLNAIRQTISTINESNLLPTNENYKENQQRRQTYMKYKNDSSDYNSSVVNSVLDTIPANRNGNRTVNQWLQAAENIGQQISDLSNEEIEKIAYKSWFELQPTKNITQYDNQAKQKVGFQKLTSDEWINTINNAVNQARENQPVQQATPPIQQSTVTSSDDLISSARKYNLKYQDSNLNQVQNVFKNKGIDSRFDASKFTDNKTGAMWQLTRDQDGNVRREIILNPNADEKTVIQEMAMHELTHDIVAKNTDTSNKLYNEVRDWLARDSEYQNQLEQLKSVYGDNVVEEEAIAKTLQTKFGNQESIDNLVNYNPSMARKIYDWVVDKLNKITGGRIEKLYWEDVKNKFERAYSEQGEYTKNNTTRYSKDLKERQNSIIQNSNPLNQELGGHTWINNINDIKTYKEAIDDFGGIDNITPDYTAQDVQKALDTGKITVYSSYPIEQGVFVTPSKMEAQSYAGSNQIYSKEVNLDDVAWIDEIQGQYANVNEQNITDNQGRTLSPQQQEYFKDSKIRDENGNLLVMYHGTPNGDFNEFRSGTYFSPREEYATGYQNPSASMLTQKQDSSNPKTYKVYLNITNPFTLQNPNAKKIYIDEYIKGGNSLYYDPYTDWSNDINNLEEIDWTEGEDLREWLQENHPEYDGLVLDEGGDGGYGESEYKWRGKSYMPFNANQIKNIDNIKPTDSPDIRYSDNANFDEYIQNRVGKQGTRTTLGDLKLPVQQQTIEQTTPVLPTNKTMNPTEISQLTEAEAPKQELPTKTENTDKKIAEVLDKPIKEQKPKQRTWAIIKANLVDKGAVFEDLSRKTNNRELQAKWDATLSSGARGQYAIGQDRYEFKDGKQNKISKSLESIISEVGENESDFQNYMYHQLNVDRMTLDQRYGIDNKPVFGDSIDAEYSRRKIADLEQEHPEFKEYAQDVYDFLNANKQAMVDSGIISQELSDELAKRYPHYVPIQRIGVEGAAINVPLDTKRTGVNAPLKRAKGGSQDIQPLFNTIADRTLQTYRAGARNSFGVELKNSLQQLNLLNQSAENIDIDNVLDSVATDDTELLKKGEKGKNPTFTVFENGNKVTYDINDDMYDALKPKNELLRKLDESKLSTGIRKFGNFRRGLLTEYNPIFSITNSLKDAQDVLMNSQHAAKTYKKLPEAYSQILGKGYYYQEYLQNGGEQNSYFNEGDFKIKEKGGKLDKLKMPLEMISKVNNVIEMAPRLAEYIASRESGRSVETSMLDAARVTTNFKAGGDVTKFANRNGATFLNAGVQGLAQNIRNIQEAHQKGFKGYAVLAGKLAVAGLPAMILNHLVWRDDKDYEELQDYVKDNYYIIGKYGDGQFIRIPKGRTVAVVQKIVNNIDDFITNDKLDANKYASQFWKDLKEDIKFGVDNLAPNNPIDNNIISPIIQAATNKTWYGEDLVPTRLQDKPKAEQYDESTDKFSRWLGEKTGISPVKINYLLDQYTGGVGDILLPMGTPQAENNAIEDKFTTNSVMKSRYPGEFFEKFDELNVQNNSEKATDEDKLKYKYFSGVRSQTSDLYKQKREIQNSNKSDAEKKKELLEVQKQINKITKDALEGLDKVKVSGNTATVGNQEYYKYKDTWTKLTDKEKIEGVSLKDYATFRNITEGLTKESEKVQALVKSNISDSNKAKIYKNTIGKDDKYFDTAEKAKININNYLNYKANIGTTKASAMEYLNKSNIGYEQKLLLLGTKYALSNQEKSTLAKYINNLNITKSDKLDIYKQLTGFKVNGDKISW